MRILVTSSGKKEISKYIQSQAEPSKLTKSSRPMHSGVKSSIYKFDHVGPSKFVQVNQKRVVIPKTLSDKYNTDEPDVPLRENTLSMMTEDNRDTGLVDSVRLRDIFKKPTISQIKEDVQKSNQNRRKIYSFGERDYRFIFPSEKQEVKSVDKLLNFQIETDNNSLINYLNSKGRVNHKLVSVINKYDNDKISKLNKICQKEMKKEDFRAQLRRKMERIKQKKYFGLQNQIRNSLGKAQRCLNNVNEASRIEQVPDRAWDVIETRHEKYMEKYWNKLNSRAFR